MVSPSFSWRGRALAILPSAIGEPLPGAPAEGPKPPEPTIAVVPICGPIMHAPCWPMLCYADVLGAVRTALASEASTVVLWIDSPGGEVAGTFDCARDMRAAAAASGKKLIAFTEGRMCSAAYALGCAADEIVAADTAEVGSVGTIVDVLDASAALAAQGLKHTLVKSGARKGDVNPTQPLTDAAEAAVQQRVDDMAEVFLDWVGKRRDMRPSAVRALEADFFVGERARAKGLVDRIESWSALMSRLGGAAVPTVSTDTTRKIGAAMSDDKDKKEDALRASLVTATESDDPDKKEKAKRALAAYDGEKEGDDKDKDKEKSKAESDEEAKKASTAAIAGLNTALASALATIAELKAPKVPAAPQLSEAEQRAAIFAARPDLPAATVAAFAAVPTAGLATVVAAIPKASFTPVAGASHTPSAGAPMAQPGALQLDVGLSEDQRAAFAAIDNADKPLGCAVVGGVQYFGVPVSVPAKVK